MELATAAALPEVTCTVWSNVFLLAGLRRGDTFLVHGGSSGIGTMAIQLAVRAGARVFTTAGTEAKLDFCRELGAEVLINYRDEDFAERVARGDRRRRRRRRPGQHGRQVPGPQRAVARDRRPAGHHRHAGRHQGRARPRPAHAQARLTLHATTLRSRPATGPGGKAEIVAAVRHDVWPDVERGVIRPIVDRRLPMSRAADAHRAVEASEHIGKVLLLTED